MRFEIRMPDVATTESKIRIVRWIVQPGQKVARGEPLVEVETDKATMEVESVVSGVLVEVRSQVDESVSVGDVIAVLEVEGASRGAFPRGPCQLPRRPPRPPHRPSRPGPRPGRPAVRPACSPAIGPQRTRRRPRRPAFR